MRTLLHNALVFAPGQPFQGWVLTEDRFIEDVGRGEPRAEIRDSAGRILDLEGKWLMPGVIDTHVHFRDPGLTHKADMASESRAAVAGGVTSVIDMPNTVPQTTSVEAWARKMALADENCLVNYGFFIGATNDNSEALTKIDHTRVPGVKLFLGSSTGDMLVNGEAVLDAIFSLPCLIVVHSEDEATIKRNVAAAKERYDNEEVPVNLHPQIRSEEACYVATCAAVERASRLNTRLHVLHVSTAKELDLFSARPLAEKRITAEVCVQHLWFCSDDYVRLGARIKCNPSIKSATDRKALRRALTDGRIDTVATDHAPHLLSEKSGGALRAASGIPLIQYSLPAMLTIAAQEGVPVARVVELMCGNPAALYGIDRRGELRKGYYADMVVVDPDGVTNASDDGVFSKCRWTPFHNMEFPFAVISTYVNGTLVYDRGEVYPHKALPLRFNH